MLEKKQLQIEKIHTSENGLDMIIKSLPKEKMKSCMQKVGLVETPYDLERGDLLGSSHLDGPSPKLYKFR